MPDVNNVVLNSVTNQIEKITELMTSKDFICDGSNVLVTIDKSYCIEHVGAGNI